VQVTVRYFAAAKAAAGKAEERFDVGDASTLGDLLDRVEAALPDAGGARQVLARCSVLRNGETSAAGSTRLADGDVVDLLPPFAGG
jgi:sulfur-carrier protein